MRNFIFISPNFPDNYRFFCRELKNDGFNVLGIGDDNYDGLSSELKESLTEYYKVSSLENYDEVYRAVAFFIHKYGEIEFLESNNEYWLERDAKLRTAFNITTGYNANKIKSVKYKSRMKKYFQKAGISSARHYLVKSLSGCKKFIAEAGYPVVVKPDNGVGANATYRINNEEELVSFMNTNPKGYIMEEYVDGIVNSYDAIVDAYGNPVFETGLCETASLMDTVNNGENSLYYYPPEIKDDIRSAGRAVLKAFGVKNRFVHFEFFRLSRDQAVGKKGGLAALEVNMRPAGGCSADMINYANSTDAYKIWADVLAYGSTLKTCGKKHYCGFAGRRDGKSFAHTEEEIKAKYSAELRIAERVPEVLAGAMGNYYTLAVFDTKERMLEYFKYVTE